MRQKRWTKQQLITAAKQSRSIRQVLSLLNLKQAGGNYSQIKRYLKLYEIETLHFKGKLWNKGLKMPYKPKIPLDEILVKNNYYQSFKLKARLFREGLKVLKCEVCGWSELSIDGRIPLELDHINGDRTDNRLSNLRILCPNCHSLQPTHRGLNSNKISG